MPWAAACRHGTPRWPRRDEKASTSVVSAVTLLKVRRPCPNQRAFTTDLLTKCRDLTGFDPLAKCEHFFYSG